MNYCSIDSCFDTDRFEERTLAEIVSSPLTDLICKYKDFDVVLKHTEDYYSDVALIADVCDLPLLEVRRQLMEKELVGALNVLAFPEDEAKREEYKGLFAVYENCLLSEHKKQNVPMDGARIDLFDKYIMEKARASEEFNSFVYNCDADDVQMMLSFMGTDYALAATARKEQIVFWYLLRMMRDGAEIGNYEYFDTAFDILDTVTPKVN